MLCEFIFRRLSIFAYQLEAGRTFNINIHINQHANMYRRIHRGCGHMINIYTEIAVRIKDNELKIIQVRLGDETHSNCKQNKLKYSTQCTIYIRLTR